ncbi:MAG: hypothetical protein ABUS49_00485 [Acidobacteriota bacterium]
MKPWLERELANQLRPVKAPPGLWEKGLWEKSLREKPGHVIPPVFPRRRAGWPLTLWPALAAAVLIVSAALFLQARMPLRDMTQITNQDLRVLADASTGSVFRSDDPNKIRHWVKTRGNIDIELPPNPVRGVHLLGAKLVELRGTLIAAVAYHIGDEAATLLVSRKRAAFWSGDRTSKHLFTQVATSQGPANMGSNMLSWSMREQNYAIAYTGTGDPQAGCLLCHADLHGRL